MVERVTVKLIHRLEEAQLINRKVRELYEYALITLIERYITIGTIILLSVIYRQIIPTICFLLFFLSLRKRTGGYHADKFWKCYLGTVLTYVVINIIVPLFLKNITLLYGLLFISIIIIAAFGTVNHPNINMDSNELRESKKAARLQLFLESMIILLLIKIGGVGLCVVYLSISIILCSVLLCMAKITKQEVKMVLEEK